MIAEIFNILEKNAIGMILVLCFWITLLDKMAIERINNKPAIKRIIYIIIIFYYLFIVLDIILSLRNS